VVDPYENGLVILELQGDPRSLLREVLLALARVPFDQAPALRWRERLSRRLLLPRWLRPLADLVAVVAPAIGAVDLAYGARREAGQLVVEGAAPGLSTRAVVDLGRGEHRNRDGTGGRAHGDRPAPLENGSGRAAGAGAAPAAREAP